MKIATWNIDRLKLKKNIIPIAENIQKINADILILTEYNNDLDLSCYKYKIETDKILENKYNYKDSERRVAIFSNFPIKQVFKTYDSQTSCCAEFQTDFGNLIVYGTIVGIIGYSDKNFKSDLINQINDIKNISKLGNICFSGDLNISFSDNYYFTNFGRENFLECFKTNKLKNLTENQSNNIDHIVISESFIMKFQFEVSEWNNDKKLSDHKGICLNLTEK